MPEVWFVRLVVDGPEAAGMAEETIGGGAVSIIAREFDGGPRWELILQFGTEPDRDMLITRLNGLSGPGSFELSVEEDPGTDWVARYRRNTQPVKAGRFFVYPAHFDGGAPADAIPLRMDAGLAFGTGDHATTTGCLRAMDRLAAAGFAPRRALDLGCGTGILAIAMHLLWPDAEIIAADIDPVAIETARRNVAHNDVGARIGFIVCDGWPPMAPPPFDLCAANILAGPLVSVAGDMAAGLAPGGQVILSGILTGQAGDVGAAYQAAGFTAEDRADDGEWSTLGYSRP